MVASSMEALISQLLYKVGAGVRLPREKEAGVRLQVRLQVLAGEYKIEECRQRKKEV